ncbi:hypothetical protein LSTR_LSTR002121 [Laodelphax striatellus]|uniref:Uncharacterized protein n=1 Tax=Laodelphax striatellus TaxID=195883 RepID=A0A482XPI4_LAOST|nr:hypothetical protein LSTR_LSTR002121 [Laodelphax striatellus]
MSLKALRRVAFPRKSPLICKSAGHPAANVLLDFSYGPTLPKLFNFYQGWVLHTPQTPLRNLQFVVPSSACTVSRKATPLTMQPSAYAVHHMLAWLAQLMLQVSYLNTLLKLGRNGVSCQPAYIYHLHQEPRIANTPDRINSAPCGDSYEVMRNSNETMNFNSSNIDFIM